MNRNSLFGTIGIVALIALPSEGTICYVTANGTGDGLSWESACSFGTAITRTDPECDEIWVAKGTYSPFSLKNGAKIIGGFAGVETSASQSNPSANPTIVDGGGASQCIWSTNDAASTVLRGFTIQNGFDVGDDGGGGVVTNNSSALFVDCEFKNNVANRFGGAVATRGGGAPEFINCVFHDNGDDNGTAGDATDDRPLGGGAVYVYAGTPKFTNCLFYKNLAWEGAVSLSIFGSPTFINCTIADNRATLGDGGAIHDEQGGATIKNSILWGNSAARTGDQVYCLAKSSPTAVTNTDVQGGFPGAGNIDADPQFTNPAAGIYKITDSSPCYNAGSNADLPTDTGDIDWDLSTSEQLPKDLGNQPRRTDFYVDVGAYEAKKKSAQ